jgi:hypothetical protein
MTKCRPEKPQTKQIQAAVIQGPEQSPNKELQPNRVTTGTIVLKFMLFLNCSTGHTAHQNRFKLHKLEMKVSKLPEVNSNSCIMNLHNAVQLQDKAKCPMNATTGLQQVNRSFEANIIRAS